MGIISSCLILPQFRIRCQFYVREIQILLIFSWVNDFKKKKKKSTKLIKNDLLGVVFKYVVVHFLQKKLVFWPKFALLGFIFPNLVWYR